MDRNLFLLVLFVSVCVSGCFPSNGLRITYKGEALSQNAKYQVSNIQFIENQFVLTGTNLQQVTEVKIKDGESIIDLSIDSKSSGNIIAKALANTILNVDKMLEIVISSAGASTTYAFNFSLCHSTLGEKGFACDVVPNDKEVLSYDATTGKWKPRAVNGLSYKGVWDAGDPFPDAYDSGEYYIVGQAGGIYEIGDWIVYNGSTFNKIDNSQSIVSVFGKTGVVTANLSDLSDIVISDPEEGQVLSFNGTSWVNADSLLVETDPNVLSFAKTSLPVCGSQEVLKSDGSVFSCVTDQAGASAFTGTGERIVVTNSSGNLATSTIDSESLENLIPWAEFGLETVHPSRLSLGLINNGKALTTDGSGVITASAITSTELNYLNDVTSNIQTQLDSKISTETDPSVSGFAKASLPTCDSDEVLQSDGTSFTCVNITGDVETDISWLQTQLNSKQNLGKITTNLQDAGTISPYGTSAGQTGEFRFYELVANGTNYTGFKAPDLLAANFIYTLPQLVPTNGQVLSSNASGVLSWIDRSSTGAVTSVNGSTGVVSLTTTNVAEGAGNLYFSGVRVLATQITSPTLTNSAIATNDTIQTSLGKLQAQISNRESSITAGTTAQYFRGDKSWRSFATDVLATTLASINTVTATAISASDSVLSGLGKLQGQLGNKADRSNLTQEITASLLTAQKVTGLQAPFSSTDAVSKSYVDTAASAWSIGPQDIYRSTGKVGIGTSTPNNLLSVNGIIESYTGGFRFPDGSIQTTAVTGNNYWSPGSIAAHSNFKTGTYDPKGQLGVLHSAPSNGSVDDGFYTFTLPFPINFNGTDYSTVYISTNSYITFGSGSTAYSALGPTSPALNKIMIAAADRSSNSIWFNSSPTEFTIRYEGGCSTSPGNTQVWEMHADTLNPDKIKINIISLCAGGYSVIADTTSTLFPFVPNAGVGYELDKLDNPVSSNIIYHLGGNVGIGTNAPGLNTRFKVDGQIVGKNGSVTTDEINFSLGNTILTSYNCGSVLKLHNVRDGGDYKVIATNAGTSQCNFDTHTVGDDSSLGITYRFSPANAARTASSHTIYNLTRVGNVIYVNWVTGYN